MASALGIKPGHVKGLLSGYIPVGPELAKKLAEDSGKPVMHFLVQPTSRDLEKLMRLGILNADGSPRMTEQQLGQAHQKFLADLDGFTKKDILDALVVAEFPLSLELRDEWEAALILCRLESATRLPDALCEALNTHCGFNIPVNPPQSEDVAKPRGPRRAKKQPAVATKGKGRRKRALTEVEDGVAEPVASPKKNRNERVLGTTQLTPTQLHTLFGGKVQVVKVGGSGGQFEFRASATVEAGELVTHLIGTIGRDRLIHLLLGQQSAEDSE